MKNTNFFSSRIKSFKHAFDGLIFLLKNEVNAGIHLTAAILAVLLGVFLKISLSEWLWISLAIVVVFILELINTAIEKLADLVDPEYNKIIKHIKDMSAAAVFLAAIFSLVVAGVIFISKISQMVII